MSIVYADDLARALGVSEEEVFEMARLQRLPCAVTSSSPRRLFVRSEDVDIWRRAIECGCCE